MTEGEWLECTDPTQMLAYLVSRTSDRKFRLFACACCRRIWHLLSVEIGQRSVLTAELHADGLVGDKELRLAAPCGPYEELAADTAASCTTWEHIRFPWQKVGVGADDAASIAAINAAVTLKDFNSERTWQTTLVRDIFGNPFRPVTLDPRWLTSTVVDLAAAIYQERAFDRMPILADALMDAGCDSEDIIQHCRGPGPHVKGCFVVDLLLGKK